MALPAELLYEPTTNLFAVWGSKATEMYVVLAAHVVNTTSVPKLRAVPETVPTNRWPVYVHTINLPAVLGQRLL